MPALPPFHVTIAPVSAAQLGAFVARRLPGRAGPARRLLRLLRRLRRAGAPRRAFVNRASHRDVDDGLPRLYNARFPIRRMQPISRYGGSDARSAAADNTSAFNCRYAVAPGPKRWSAHAYGLAIDVNIVENPYIEGGRVSRRRVRAYLDRSRYRPGMAVAGGVLVRAFASVGWRWGGRWAATPGLPALLERRLGSPGTGRTSSSRSTLRERRERTGTRRAPARS